MTSNAGNPARIRDHILEVPFDHLAAALEPDISTTFIQSPVPELAEHARHSLNPVTVGLLQRNPRVKEKIRSEKVCRGNLCRRPVSRTPKPR